MKKKNNKNITITKNKLKKILLWCVLKFGENPEHNDYPELFVLKSKQTFLKKYKKQNKKKICSIKGEYDILENRIYVYLWANKDIKDCCQTIIHEYMHYLEREKELNNESEMMEEALNYLAEKVAKTNYLECLSDLNYLEEWDL